MRGNSAVKTEEKSVTNADQEYIRHAIDAAHADGKSAKLVPKGWEIDFSDRKRVEEALRDRESHLRAILHSVLDAIITIDEVGRSHRK
jgi:two-component system sensor kinase FixL